jgi:Spy/CpxP family protein refolding chaperone
MKKLALTLVVVGAAFGLASETFAQAAGPRGGAPGQAGPGQRGPGGPGGRMRGGGMRRLQEMNNRIFAQLKLTPAQKTKVEALNKKTGAKMQEMMKGFQPGGDRQAMMAKFRGVQQEHRKELMKILTPEQGKKYEALVKAEREKMRRERGMGGPGGAPGRPGAPKPGGPGRGL